MRHIPTVNRKNLSNTLSYFEQGMNTFLQNDPSKEHITKISQEVNSTITWYKTVQEDAESKVKQTTLDQYFILSQSTTVKSDDGSIL